MPQLFVPSSLTLRVSKDMCPRFQREKRKRSIGVPRLRACTSLPSGRSQKDQLPDSRSLSPEKGRAVRSRSWLCEPAVPTHGQDICRCSDDGERGVIIGTLEALGDTYPLSGPSPQTAFTKNLGNLWRLWAEVMSIWDMLFIFSEPVLFSHFVGCCRFYGLRRTRYGP